MLSKTEALDAAKKKFPDRRVEPYLEYHGLLLITVINDNDPDEGEFDPYHSVNLQTGEIREFSVITDANRVELTNLWLAQN